LDKPPFLILTHATKKSRPRTEIISLVITNDNEVLASVGADGNIKLWDTTTGKRLHQLEGHYCAFTADGKYLFIPHPDVITIWDVASGGKRLEIKTDFAGLFHAMTISPDGKTLAIGDDTGRIRLWDVKSLLEEMK
jgi:WD40 repeat protein